MTALVLGDEKRAKPKPRRVNVRIILYKPVSSVMKVKRKSPMTVKDIPAEATILGSMRSETLPAKGEKTVMTTGWETRMRPAC